MKNDNEVVLSGPQFKILSDPRRFTCLVAGRRFGKTFLGRVKTMEMALAKPNQKTWHVFPTLGMGREISWEDTKSLALPYMVDANETHMNITLRNGSVFGIRGADRPDNLRGRGLNFAVLEEYGTMDSVTWTEVLRPALADKQGGAMIVGTPAGWNHFKDLYDNALLQPALWGVYQFTTLEGGNVTREEIEMARADMDERTFRQEFLATFETIEGRVYYNFDRRKNVNFDVADQPGGSKLLIGMDFNVMPMCAVVCIRFGDALWVFDEIVMQNSSTEEMCAEIKRRYGSRRSVIFPDPAGNQRRTNAPVGQTDFAILRRNGFKLVYPRLHPPVADRVNEVNGLLLNAKGDVRLLIHPRCKNLIRGLDGLTYKEGSSMVDKTTGLDHITDALGYLVHSEFPIRAYGKIGIQKVTIG